MVYASIHVYKQEMSLKKTGRKIERLKGSYLIIIYPNSHQKLTKGEIMSRWTRFEYCSKSLF